nr:uncharacterized protein LOC129155851 [Nothobranchius furzeri]
MQAGVRTRKGNKGEIKETVQQFDVGEMEDGAAVDLGDTEDEEIREPTLKDLTSILQTFMGQQDMRDKKREEESEQQEQRFKALQHQFHLLQMGMQARATPELGRDDSEQVGLSSDDYNQVSSEPECSTSTSAASSTGQSLQTPHFKMEKLTAEDVIEHFLTTFERIAVAYRWRSSDWTFHLIPLLTGKARGAYVNMDIDDALDYQKVWIKEHKPRSAAEAAALADVFVAARSKSQPWSNTAWRTARDMRRPQPLQHQRAASGLGKVPTRENRPQSASKFNKRIPVCYLCGQEGHTKPVCPQNPSRLNQLCFLPQQMVKREPEKHNSKKMTTVTINGQKIEALLDTGSTLVNRNCIPFSDWGMSEPITVCCVHGDEKSYPTADLCIGVQGATYLLKVGVADNLPYPVILGEDLPVIYDLLKEVESCNAAVTRAQAKTQSDQFTTLSSLPFFDSDVEGQPGKTLKACSQKRHEKLEYNVQRGQNEEAPDLPLGFTIPNDIRQMQQDDLTLSALLLKAKGETEAEYDTKRGRYILQHGILYHHHGQMK